MDKEQLRQHRRKLIQALHRRGFSLRRIARNLGLHRSTVRKLLEEKPQESSPSSPPPPPPPPKVPSMLESFRQRIETLAKDKELTTQRIFEILQDEGYKGGRTILGKFLQKLRGAQKGRKAFARYEPLMAQEGQCDFSPYLIKIGDKVETIHLFSLILSYSRHQFLEGYLDEKQDTLFQGHVEAFHYQKGIPYKILYDSQSAVVACRIAGHPVYNPRFEAFAAHYGFVPDAGMPGHPERRGRVERAFYYFEKNFLPGRTFESLEDFRRQLRQWLEGLFRDSGNLRIHATTRRRPVDMWEEEREFLISLPATDFLPTRIEYRPVYKDCMVSVLGNRYTVPPRYVGQTVTLLISPVAIQVYDTKRSLIATHRIPAGKGKLVIDEAHYAELRKGEKKLTASELERHFLSLFPDQPLFLEGLKRWVKSAWTIHLHRLNRLLEHFSVEQVRAALIEAQAHGTCHTPYVAEVLRRWYPSQVCLKPFDPKSEKPKGLHLGALEIGTTEGYDAIFDNDPKGRPEDGGPSTNPEDGKEG